MVADGEYTAVLDRFEEGLAVLLVERDGETVDQLVVDRDRVPDEGCHEDAVLVTSIQDGDVRGLRYRPEETERRTESAQDRFDRLAERPPSGDEGESDGSDGAIDR